MQTVAQAKDEHLNNEMKKQTQPASGSYKSMITNQSENNIGEFARMMRAANFKMGSVLPEHDRSKVVESAKLGMVANVSNSQNQRVDFRQQAKSIVGGPGK